MKTFDCISFGHTSCEHDISVITACLMQQTHLKILYFDRDGQLYLLKDRIIQPSDFITNKKIKGKKCVLIAGDNTLYAKFGKLLIPLFKINSVLMCFHGSVGENGQIQSLFNLCKIAYSGCDVLQSALCMNKIASKRVLHSLDYPLLPFYVLSQGQYAKGDKAPKLDFPLIVKPSTQGSSIGISQVNNQTEYQQALELAFYYDNFVIVEQALTNFFDANCAALCVEEKLIVSNVECPQNVKGIYTYEQKYMQKNLSLPNSNIDENISRQIKSMTSKICEDLNLSGVIRVDFLVQDEKVFVNEINTIPGSLSYHLFMDKLSKIEFVKTLLHQAVLQREKQSKLIKSYKSSVLSRTTLPNKK